jgi:hypothetical protein
MGNFFFKNRATATVSVHAALAMATQGDMTHIETILFVLRHPQ